MSIKSDKQIAESISSTLKSDAAVMTVKSITQDSESTILAVVNGKLVFSTNKSIINSYKQDLSSDAENINTIATNFSEVDRETANSIKSED